MGNEKRKYNPKINKEIKEGSLAMKKTLVILSLFLILPAFSACPIEGGETVCSLPNFREQVNPVLDVGKEAGNIKTPSVQLQPLQREDPINQMRTPNNSLNYKSGCQFGVCLQENKQNTLMQK